jgi:pyruvate/2-oxoglutarate dehydrogenase complex dihydrolipoamide dehydrogenase (E3) component
MREDAVGDAMTADVIVIGSGVGGPAAALTAADAGKNAVGRLSEVWAG